MGIRWVEICGRFINPARIAQVGQAPWEEGTRIYFSMLGDDYDTYPLPIDEVMRLLRGLSSGPVEYSQYD